MLILTDDASLARRIKVLEVQADLYLHMLRAMAQPSEAVVASGLPGDAKLVGLALDQDRRTVRMFVESETFPEVRPGDLPQSLSITFHSYYLPIAELGGLEAAQEVLIAAVREREAAAP